MTRHRLDRYLGKVNERSLAQKRFPQPKKAFVKLEFI